MFDWLYSYEFLSVIGLVTYWIPLLIVAVVYLNRFVVAYKKDISTRSEQYYHPTLTIGLVIGHALIVVIPVVNLLAALFDCQWSVFKSIGKFLDKPLVPRKRSLG